MYTHFTHLFIPPFHHPSIIQLICHLSSIPPWTYLLHPFMYIVIMQTRLYLSQALQIVLTQRPYIDHMWAQLSLS